MCVVYLIAPWNLEKIKNKLQYIEKSLIFLMEFPSHSTKWFNFYKKDADCMYHDR